jgi:hypothetical protein
MGAFKKLGGCTILSISENSQTTNDGIMQLGAIPGLKIISIKKSDLITTDGIQAFHKAFPDVLIR